VWGQAPVKFTENCSQRTVLCKSQIGQSPRRSHLRGLSKGFQIRIYLLFLFLLLRESKNRIIMIIINSNQIYQGIPDNKFPRPPKSNSNPDLCPSSVGWGVGVISNNPSPSPLGVGSPSVASAEEGVGVASPPSCCPVCPPVGCDVEVGVGVGVG